MGFNFINQHSTSERHFEAEIFHSFCEITVKVAPLISHVIVDLILLIKTEITEAFYLKTFILQHTTSPQNCF